VGFWFWRSNGNLPQTKRHPEYTECLENGKPELFLYAQDRVFCRFGDAELHDFLGFDLDLLTSCRITTDPGFAINEHQLAETRNGERVFSVFICQCRELFENFARLLFGDVVLFRDRRRDLEFCECFTPPEDEEGTSIFLFKL